MVVLGIDPNTREIGMALLSPLSEIKVINCRACGWSDQWLNSTLDARCWTVSLKDCKGDLDKIAAVLHERLCEGVGVLPDLVAIEREYIKFPKAAIPLAELIGMIRQVFSKSRVVTITASQARKALTGDGRASNEKVTRMLEGMGYGVGDVHQACALAVAITAERRANEPGQIAGD